MTGATLLRSVVAALDESGVPFMLTGSLAAAFYGAGRATLDIDLVIDPNPVQLRSLVQRLEGQGAYVSQEAADEALADRSMFNVVDTETGWKADLIVRKRRLYSETEFARRQVADFEGTRLYVATVEDVILSKLEWAKLGNSARQLEDVSALLRIHAGRLDSPYLERWVAALEVGTQWQAVSLGGAS